MIVLGSGNEFSVAGNSFFFINNLQFQSMRLSYLLSFLMVFSIFVSLNAQDENTETHLTPGSFEKIQTVLSAKFQNYYVIDTIAGELNMDDELDCVALLERIVSEAEYEENEFAIDRIVVFLIQKDGQYKIVANNPNIIECTKCGGGGVGDPYQSIIIENGTITFNTLYGACDRTANEHIFKYSTKKNNWYLFQSTRTDWNCNDLTEEHEVITHSTVETQKDFGKVTFGDF